MTPTALFVTTLCQYLLYGLLFFQQERTKDALTDTGVAQGSTVATRDLAFALLGALVLG